MAKGDWKQLIVRLDERTAQMARNLEEVKADVRDMRKDLDHTKETLSGQISACVTKDDLHKDLAIKKATLSNWIATVSALAAVIALVISITKQATPPT